MYELAAEQLPRWRSWAIFSEYNIARMEEVETTSEFALLMTDGIAGKSATAINNAYRDRDETFAQGDQVARRFRATMDAIDERLGASLSTSSFRKKTLFYSLFGAFYDHLWGIGSS